MKSLILAALVGVMHVHHEPSHDSDASFQEVMAAADQAGLDFVVLTDHADVDTPVAPPGSEHAGVRVAPSGRRILVLVGAELASDDGHLLGLDIQRAVPAIGRRGRDVIRDIHAQGGFAVVAHPYSHGGWHDWSADFDGMEVQNSASDFLRLYNPLLPYRLVRFAFDRDLALRTLWRRPDAELAKWDELLASGRHVIGFAGTDAHRNVSLFGWQLDPYAQMFRGPRMVCPDAPLDTETVWRLLKSGACAIRNDAYESRAREARRVVFPSGRVEWQLDGGDRVLEVDNPPPDPPLYSAP